MEFGTKVVESFTKAKDKIDETVGMIVAKISEIATKISSFVTETIAKWDPVLGSGSSSKPPRSGPRSKMR